MTHPPGVRYTCYTVLHNTRGTMCAIVLRSARWLPLTSLLIPYLINLLNCTLVDDDDDDNVLKCMT